MKLKKISLLLLLPVLILVAVFFLEGSEKEKDLPMAEAPIVETISAEGNQEPEDAAEDVDDDETTVLDELQSELGHYEGEFELPVEGAAGYASIDLPLHASSDKHSDTQMMLTPGTAFVILSEEGNWWQVQTSEAVGWIEHKYAFINLPDIIPSIVYDNTNSYASVFTSSKHEIPELTHQSLYHAYDYNERLEEEAFIMPILYATAKKVNLAQKNALAHNEALKIYETFRPLEAQELIAQSVAALAEENEEVHAGLNKEPWSLAWFIITNSISNHQIGAAMDVSLVSVDAIEEIQIGDYLVPKVTAYTELQMQSSMHELSAASVIFEEKVSSDSKTDWLDQALIDTMTEPAIRLQQYATQAGFTPIASEWWHFNDLDAVESLGEQTGTGEFHLTETINRKPTIPAED